MLLLQCHLRLLSFFHFFHFFFRFFFDLCNCAVAFYFLTYEHFSGLAAGVYSGLTYGLTEARGAHDWVICSVSFFFL